LSPVARTSVRDRETVGGAALRASGFGHEFSAHHGPWHDLPKKFSGVFAQTVHTTQANLFSTTPGRREFTAPRRLAIMPRGLLIFLSSSAASVIALLPSATSATLMQTAD